MKLKQFLITLKSYTAIGLITLVFLEIAFQFSSFKPLQNLSGFNNLYKVSDRDKFGDSACGSYWWKSQFIKRYESDRGLIRDARLHDTHPTRGWTPKPNLSVTIDNIKYTTNQQGHRALKDYKPNPEQYTVLVVGDSYTFGIDTDDSFLWTNLLQAKDRRLNIINLGVGGYGLDQIYITLKESIKTYQPDLVIAAFISDDIFRMRFDFRDYKKPILKIKGDKLIVKNTPIGSLEETYQEVKQELKWTTIPFLKLDDVVYNLSISCREVNYQLPSKVFLEMLQIAQQEKADFLLTYLASNPEVENPNHTSYGEKVFQQFISENEVDSLNTRPYFLAGNKAGKNYGGGHYQKSESILVGDIIYDRIKDSKSFQTFIVDRVSPSP
ncbi:MULTISPECIES: SGNH/GDSL hydrolase family protein [Spirulina sp. CCY15215]|uniref:SGNH/GDSL hydrolase family protein n=1 Tax=Spirulina sp. CCY15215 TaxID=2767591 RepID=UPI001950EDC7|nr:SGNH/GDSL hydrolase family protein [Spirulina major]